MSSLRWMDPKMVMQEITCLIQWIYALIGSVFLHSVGAEKFIKEYP